MIRRMRKFTLTNPPVVMYTADHIRLLGLPPSGFGTGRCAHVCGWLQIWDRTPHLVAYLHFARPTLFLFAVRRSTFPRMLYLEVFCFAPLSYLGIQLTFETKESENMDKRPETCL
jgi:hypothetical protein